MRLLLVDDDPGLRQLVRTTFEVVDVDVDEAGDAADAEVRIRERRPDVIVLDVGMPGVDGIAFCRRLKDDARTRGIPVVLLSGSVDDSSRAAEECGAEAFLAKPFSPLQLLAVVERLAGVAVHLPPVRTDATAPDTQLLLYARDLRRLLEIERGQRALVQRAYRDTVSALAGALESKDTGTRAHSQRVQRYALALTNAIDADLADDETVQYGFLLHDVGKIGIPDSVLQKPGPLSAGERRLMQTHTILGEQMLSGVSFLQGDGLAIVRSHHERWDGGGYPDGLDGTDIPLAARVFAVADSLDAITSDRPYRRARPWSDAVREIRAECGSQFDPTIVDAFLEQEEELQEIRHGLVLA